MKSISPLGSELTGEWPAVEARMKVVSLDARVGVLVPLLALSSISRSTRGLTLYPGKAGVAIGSAVAAASLAIAYELLFTGLLMPILVVWLLGSAGAATLVSSLRPTAFVKPICTRCRLLPVIKEHEAIHLTGVASEREVWESMKTRHTAKTLSLEGDSAICSFCPIPKRLAEH